CKRTPGVAHDLPLSVRIEAKDALPNARPKTLINLTACIFFSMPGLAGINDRHCPLLGTDKLWRRGVSPLGGLGFNHNMPGALAAQRISDGNEVARSYIVNERNPLEAMLLHDGIMVGNG